MHVGVTPPIKTWRVRALTYCILLLEYFFLEQRPKGTATPSERLPSLKGKRDLTLGGVKKVRKFRGSNL